MRPGPRPPTATANVICPLPAALVRPAESRYLPAMKTLTVREAEKQLGQLVAEAARGDVIVLTDGKVEVTLTPRSPEAVLDPEVDSPELEAELLKAIDGPYTPYSSEEMRAIGEQIIRDKRKK